MYLASLLMQLLGHRQRDGAAHAAADDRNLFQPVGMRRHAQRPDEIMQALSFFHRVQLHRRAADNLIDDGHRSGIAVKISDGQRDALAVLKCAENNKLTRLRLFRNKRRFNHHFRDGRVQAFFLDDFEHDVSS